MNSLELLINKPGQPICLGLLACTGEQAAVKWYPLYKEDKVERACDQVVSNHHGPPRVTMSLLIVSRCYLVLFGCTINEGTRKTFSLTVKCCEFDH